MAILCSLKNINLAFGHKVIFENAELSIKKGDRIGLIGLNGQGKSTLFHILNGTVEPDQSSPAFLFDKSNEHYDVFLIPQELEIEKYLDLDIAHYFLAFYPELYEIHQKLKKIEGQLLETDDYEKLLSDQEKLMSRYEELNGWNIQNAYQSYLKSFELLDHERSIKNLSGGEKRKMALSIGLSCPQEFLLWDEPTNHLDIETIEKFEDELSKTQKTYLIISHDRYLLNHVTDRIFHIEHGKVIQFTGTYLDYLEHLEEKQKELMKNLDKLENKHRRELAWMRQGIKARGTRSKKRVEGYQNMKSEISRIKGLSRKVVDLNLYHSGRKSKTLVEIKDGNFSYDDKAIFENLNLLVTKKDKIALIGPNGAGKTTLIKILTGQLQLSDGLYKQAHTLNAIVFDQNRETLDPNKTLIETVGEGNDYVILGNGHKKHIHSYLESFLFTPDQVKRPVATLSGGEKNRLQLAMFMKQSADLWVFDEPTNDLDIETIEILEKELKSYDAAVIIIGHDRAFLDNVCDSTWLVHEKNIEIFEGGYTQVAPFLHALELEKQVMQEKGKNKKEQSTPEKPKEQKQEKPKKMSYKQKQRFDVIEDEIFQAESKLEDIDDKLANFDFTKTTKESKEEYESLSQQKSSQEASIASLYEEWEELNELTP